MFGKTNTVFEVLKIKKKKKKKKETKPNIKCI